MLLYHKSNDSGSQTNELSHKSYQNKTRYCVYASIQLGLLPSESVTNQ